MTSDRETFGDSRNQTRGPGISGGTGRPVRFSEGLAAGRLIRGSDRGATSARQSEPGPPGANGGAALKRGAAPGSRTCPSCEQTKPALEFPLANDPVAVDRGWATRRWCGPCLVTSGHVTDAWWRAHLDAVAPPRPLLTEKQRARAEAKVREHAITVALIDRAAADPVYRRAMERAIRGVRLASRSMEPEVEEVEHRQSA